MFVLSGTATLYLDGLGHHELTPDTAAYIASGESYSIENDGPDPLVALVVDAPTPAEADTPALGARKFTVNFATQPDEEAGIGRTFRLLVDSRRRLRGLHAVHGRDPRRPRARPQPHLRRGRLRGRGRRVPAHGRRDAPDHGRLVHLSAAAAHALPRERGRRARCACSASSSPPAARPHATQRRPRSGHHHRARRAPEVDPPPLPPARAPDLPQQLLAGRALGRGARRLRRLPARLGREGRALGVLDGAHGVGARELRRARRRRRRRGRRDRVGLGRA